MPDDASLEDFLDADATEAAESADEATPGGASEAATADREEAQSATDDVPSATDEGGGHVSTDAVEPATPTCDWTDGGAACAACGTVVERRWRDEAGLVCGECKDW